ncbi:MAG: ABC-F family ATP-binding cassette domain-containing protein [Clostridiales bacterium]|jgi:ATPase subunit of ABC transporter with duplicated ATPase domains|nr:ABC-F family ATP-binding cassette domain-containing protein [Clostridiales bacterium]
MITVSDLGLSFNGQSLFSHVDLLFTAGNCYGVIGANGAGKSTFLKLLSGELEPTKGEIFIDPKMRMSVLKQDHHAYDEYTVLDTIIMGNPRLYEVMKQKEALYAKEDFSDEDGLLAADLEAEFAELNGWDAETEAGRLLQGLGVDGGILYSLMNTLTGAEKVKVLLARALFGRPDIILLDEPTNDLDNKSIAWLESFLMDYAGTVIVVSHDRHFLNNVCTHIVDIDYNKIRLYVGNYDFWYESSQLVQRMMRDQNRKAEEKIKELQSFIQRFSANKSKSRQATSRKKLLEKISVEEMPASSRRYPYVGFTMDREPGKEILTVENLSKTLDGVRVLNSIGFRVNKGDKIAFVGSSELANTALFKILMGETEAGEGTFKWGVSTGQSYFPQDNSAFFNGCDLTILKWLEQYSKDTTETYLRGFLGKMLFSGDDVNKPVSVLSGGEKVRCMLSRMMMFGSNVLVLDQPTNHLDLESITAVNDGLADFKGVVLFASHDHQFVQTIANRIIEFTPDGMVDRMCTYDEYLEARDGILS